MSQVYAYLKRELKYKNKVPFDLWERQLYNYCRQTLNIINDSSAHSLLYIAWSNIFQN